MHNKIHAYLGLLLVLPLFVWAVTGLVFQIKPGYEEAYEQLSVPGKPFSSTLHVIPQQNWQQLRFMQTDLGGHLLVTTLQGMSIHLDPETLKPRAHPTRDQLDQLFTAATEHNRARYGLLHKVEQEQDHFKMVTSTEVVLQLDWQTLRLQQRGNDTRFIDRLYRLHYLQWSPTPLLNQALVLLVLMGLLVMCFIGLYMLVVFHNKE